MSKTVWALAAASLLALVLPMTAFAGPITFNTFVSSGQLDAVENNHATIAFNYAGNKFVGSVYYGPNNNQLYQTSLDGSAVSTFGSPIPGASGEVVVGASLGLAGFAKGNIFAGSQANGQIWEFDNSGSTQQLFATLPNGSGVVRQIFFDPGSSFGGNMLVSTTTGQIYSIDSLGNVTFIASVGSDTEGMDIVYNPAWGAYNGNLMVASEGLGTVHFITPGGTVLASGLSLPSAETVSFVPLNLGNSGNSVEGFYVANYAVNIQKANASDFAGLQGTVIVTGESSGNSPVWDISYDGTSFSVTQPGTLPNQSEDGIFVTAERVKLVGTPEPSSMLLLISGIFGISAKLRLRKS